MCAEEKERDPWDAIPIHNPLAEVKTDSKGCCQLRAPISLDGGFWGRFSRRLGFTRYARINLDEHGSCFWTQVDGTRSLRKIEAHLRRKFSLKKDDSRKAVLQFTKMLMLRHLIQLDVSNKKVNCYER